MSQRAKRSALGTAGAMLAAALLGCGTGALAAGPYLVSQKGREFTPKEITLSRGEVVTIVNDDADLRHHAYINSSTFTFDSGDQEPGSKTMVNFNVPGTFTVLCAIHPKMRLTVKVE